MSEGRRSTSLAEIVADEPNKPDVVARRPVHAAQALQDSSEHLDANEVALRRRARRQALALIVASSLLSALAVYGMWTLLRAVF